MHVVHTCRSGGIIIRVVHVSDDRQTKHASDFFDPQKRQPFQAPRRSQASQRRFLQPNPSKRAPRSTPLGAFHPKSLFSPFSSPTTLLLTPDNPIRTASLQTPPTPPARLSPPTHPPILHNVHLLLKTALSSPSAAPNTPSISPSTSRPVVVPAEHTPCRSHPLPRLTIRPSQIDLLQPPVACEPSARLNLSSLAAHSPPLKWRRKYACSTAHRRSTPMALRPVRPCNTGAQQPKTSADNGLL